jgi:ABC-type transport system substrate-binding protein
MRPILWLMVTVLIFTAALSVSAQSGGVLVEGAVGITINADAFNPVLCAESVSACRRLMEKVYPSLFVVDPQTGLLRRGEEGNMGVIASPTLTPDEEWTLHRDLMWSDGTPVTAYDVLFTWAARTQFMGMNTPVRAMQVIDDYTLAVEYSTADCSALPRANFLVLPSHSFAPGFREYVVTHRERGLLSIVEWFIQRDFEQYFYRLLNQGGDIPPTSGEFTIAEVRPNEEIRLTSGDFAYILRVVEGDGTQAFLNGDVDVLVNPSYSRRADLLATTGLQIAEPVSGYSDVLMFNVADPNRPRSAFYESGAPIEQGSHPVFTNPDVRRAFQLAIDRDEIIRVVFQGDAIPMVSSLPATSWGYNAELEPISFNPREAERLLELAGWKAINGRETRQCVSCGTAPEGTALYLELDYQYGESREIVAELIARQARRVGFEVVVTGNDVPAHQTFDAYLGGMKTNPDPDQFLHFSQEGDVFDSGINYTSYHDDTLSDLLHEARSVPDCQPQTRAGLYRQAQALIQEEQPYAFLYTRTDFIAAQAGVVGFSPLPDRPFWNISTWRVVR